MIVSSYVNAAFPAVAVSTAEEERFKTELLDAYPERPVFSIAATGGLKDARTGNVIDGQATYPKAFAIAASREQSLLLVFDWQHVCRNAAAYRALKDVFDVLKRQGSCIILVAPSWSLPAELEHDVPVIEYALPTRIQLDAALRIVASSAGTEIDDQTTSACLNAAAGLTLQEAENAFALTLVESANAGNLHFDADRIEQEKMRLVKQSGYLEVWPPADPSMVGGLDRLKDYFTDEVMPSRDDPDLRVRGILLVGVPGTGKSLAAKAAGSLLGWPVLRMDVAALKGSLVGQSESNMRAALKLADAVAPAICWIDEIEKGVGGFASSAHTDSGVTLGMVGALLTWMQEHTSPVIVIATCNDYQKLPAELTRAGRFDERFFVDLPTRNERTAIANVHLNRFNCPSAFLADSISEMTDGWTGAEIEQLVKSAARRTNRQPTLDVLKECAKDIKPISRVRAQEIDALRQWARDSLRIANSPANSPDEISPSGRRLHIGGSNGN